MEEDKRFEEFLNRKNIDGNSFFQKEPELFQRWKQLFYLVHEESFVMQQKFYINPVRRRHPLLVHPSLHAANQSPKE